MGASAPLSKDELMQAVRELNHEHVMHGGKERELDELVRTEPAKAFRELIGHIEEILLIHVVREENHVFPTIIKIRPDMTPSIEELVSEHKGRRSDMIRLREVLTRQRKDEMTSTVRTVLEQLERHRGKEMPLFRILLEELSKQP